MKKILLFALLVLSMPALSSAQQLYAIRNTTTDGYNFWLYVPSGYKDCRAEREQGAVDKSTPAPLPIVIFLHGRSLSGNDLNKVRKYGTLSALEAGRKINAIVLAPQVKMGDWWRPNRVMSLINWVAENYDVDTSRIYVLGMSLGGYGALDFAAAYPKNTAAAMAFCGGSTRRTSELGCLNEVPLWIMHGTADTSVPVSQSRRVYEAMKEKNESTPRLRYDEFAGVGHSLFARTFYTGEAYEWLFKHSTNDPSRPVDRTVQIPQSRLTTQPYRGLKLRSIHFNVIEKSVAVPETSTLKHTTKVASKAASKATSKSSKRSDKSASKANASANKGAHDEYHTIQRGDMLSKLAVKYNTTVKQLCEWNDITETTILQVNKRLRVREAVPQSHYHTIVAGDTLYGLARKNNTTVKQLCEWNNITETTILRVGDKLRVK